MRMRRRFSPSLELLEDRCVPATFTVTKLDDAVALPGLNLREAIASANLFPDTDTIVFKDGLEGTIVLNNEIAITNNLTVKGPGTAKIAVSGNFSSRIFNINGGLAAADLTVKLSGLELRSGEVAADGGAILCQENLKLTKMALMFNQGATGGAVYCKGNLTVAKSTITGNSASGDGGGLYCFAAATISGSTITGNTTSSDGGGIFCDTATVSGSAIAGNAAGSNGGGINCLATATLTSSTISGNSAGNQGGGVRCTNATLIDTAISGNSASSTGGGLHCPGTSTILRSTISGNRATTFAGGLYCGTVTITSSTISGNQAGSSGGGMSCATATITGSTVAGNSAGTNGGGLNCGTVTIISSTISGNSAGATGGGINLFAATTSEIRNSTISGNQAGTNGGGLYRGGPGTANLRSCTIAFNEAIQKGGGMMLANADALLESCLVADNTAGTAGKNLASLNVGDTFDLDHCLISVFAGGEATLFDIGANQFNVDAGLAPLAFNGGKTQTHALKKGSLAIDAGSNSLNLTTDQRGKGFKRKVGAAVDIGAFERQ